MIITRSVQAWWCIATRYRSFYRFCARWRGNSSKIKQANLCQRIALEDTGYATWTKPSKRFRAPVSKKKKMKDCALATKIGAKLYLVNNFLHMSFNIWIRLFSFKVNGAQVVALLAFSCSVMVKQKECLGHAPLAPCLLWLHRNQAWKTMFEESIILFTKKKMIGVIRSFCRARYANISHPSDL